MPWHDWQFWVVSLVALFAAVMILRAVIPSKWQPWRSKVQGKSTTLTIGGVDARSAKKKAFKE